MVLVLPVAATFFEGVRADQLTLLQCLESEFAQYSHGEIAKESGLFPVFPAKVVTDGTIGTAQSLSSGRAKSADP